MRDTKRLLVVDASRYNILAIVGAVLWRDTGIGGSFVIRKFALCSFGDILNGLITIWSHRFH